MTEQIPMIDLPTKAGVVATTRGGEHAPMDEVRQTNQYLQIPNVETWRRTMG